MSGKNPAAGQRRGSSGLVRGVVACLLTVACQWATAEADLDSWWASLETFKAEFSELRYDRDGQVSARQEGELYFAHPGRYRCTYLKAPQAVVVADGSHLWVEGERGRIGKHDLDKADDACLPVLAVNRDTARRFDFSVEASGKGQRCYLGLPKRDALTLIEKLRICFDGETLRSSEVWDLFGRRTMIEYSHPVLNPALVSGIFHFVPAVQPDLNR